MYRVSPHVRHYAAALGAGAAMATLWVNLDHDSYFDVMEYRLGLPDLPGWAGLGDPVLSLQSLTAQGLMALFIVFIAKELWEALVLERGALAGPSRWAMPFGAVAGGVLGAVAVWLMWPMTDPDLADWSRFAGWPLPVGSDVVVCYVFGAAVFGKSHPALHLMLLLAIAFDILGLAALTLDLPVASLHPGWLLLPALALALVWRLCARFARPGATEVQHRRAATLWPYLLAGAVSWAGVVLSGLPGALGLLPLVPIIPHAERSFGLFAEAETYLHDPLNRLAQLVARPLPVVLLLFGLTQGGVDLTAAGTASARVVAALWIGKPLGLLMGAGLVLRVSGWPLPQGLAWRDLCLLAVLSGIGVTVPLLALPHVLPGGIPAAEARFGLALSLLFGPLAMGLARLTRSKPEA